MNFINEFVRQLSILRGEARSERICYITAPVEDLSDLAKTVMKGHGLIGDIQEADKYHITLAVFPDFPEEAVMDFLQISLPIKFSVSSARLGTFPAAPSNPLVLLVDPDPALIRLQSDIYNLGIKLGLQLPDPDHFKASKWQPHITLAMNVEEIPDEFSMIKPVKVGVDQFVLMRDGYDEIVEVHLPGSIGDRLLVTVRSSVHKNVQQFVRNNVVERITPETGIEVSHEEFMALMRGENVVHGATRRVLNFEDGPFAVVRHGVHIGQEGRPGQRGGSQPGYRHVAGGQGYRKLGERLGQDGWHRAVGNRGVTIVTGEGIDGTSARLLSRESPESGWVRTEIHDLPTPEEAIQLGNKWLAGAEEEIAEEQAAEREVDDEAAEEFAAAEEEFEAGVEPEEFEEEPPRETGFDEEAATEPVSFPEGEAETIEEYMGAAGSDWRASTAGDFVKDNALNNRESATAIITELGEGQWEVDYETSDAMQVSDNGAETFTDWQQAVKFAESYLETGDAGTALSAATETPTPFTDYISTMNQREGWDATHPNRPNVYRHEDTEAGRLAEILPTETFSGDERFRVGYNEYGDDVESRLSADGFRDFDSLEDALTFSEIYVETGSTGQAMERISARMTGIMEDTGVPLFEAVGEDWMQGRGVQYSKSSELQVTQVGEATHEVNILDRSAFPEDYRDRGLVGTGYDVTLRDIDEGTERIKHFMDARQAIIFAENYLESGNIRQAEFATGLGSSMTREFRQDMQFLPEWMDSLSENQMQDGGWAIRTQGEGDFSRAIISQEGVGRSVELTVTQMPDTDVAGQEEPNYEVFVSYKQEGQTKVFSTTPDRMVETLRTMEQYVEGGPPGGQAYEGVNWRPTGPNNWQASTVQDDRERVFQRDAESVAEVIVQPDGSAIANTYGAGTGINQSYSWRDNAFEDLSRWAAGGEFLGSEITPGRVPVEPFEGARAETVGEFEIGAPPVGSAIDFGDQPQPSPESAVDPETGAGRGLDMGRIINDIQNRRLTIESNSEDVDVWNDFREGVIDRDWEMDAQGIAGDIVDFADYGGEYDDDFDPYQYLQEGQYLDEYDMEQAQERWDEQFFDEAYPEAHGQYLESERGNFDIDVDDLLDEVSGLSTDEVERRIYNDAVGEVAARWNLVDDWNERTWESRVADDSQMALFNTEAFADGRDRMRWSELDEEHLNYLINDLITENGEDTIQDDAAHMMDISRPSSMDIVDVDELRQQAYGSSGGDLQYTLDKLKGANKRVIFGVDGGEVVTAAAIEEKNTSAYGLNISDSVLERVGVSREEVEGDYLYINFLASKVRRQGYGTELLLDVMRTAAAEGKGIAGSSVSTASEFYDHLGAIWVREDGARDGGTAFLTPSAVQRLHGFMMAMVAQQNAEEEGIERVAPNLLELLIEAEAKGSAHITPITIAQIKVARQEDRRAKIDKRLAAFTGREIVERARPSTRKPKAFYAPKEEREYPEYFEGQEQVGHGAYGTQVFTPYLLGHIDTWEGSRQGAAMQAYHRVVGAQKAQDKEVHGFALAHGGRFVGVGSLNFSPDEKPDDKDWISVETLAISEDGHSEAAMEKIIGEAAKYNRGIFLYGGDGAEEFLTAAGMRKGKNGQYHYTHEDVQQLASELKGPTPDRYIAPTAKPRLRPRFGRLFEESEVKAPVNNEKAPLSREQQTWQARDKWERFNWEAWKDPELVWNPENQMAMGMEEQKEELFQEEVDEEREKGKSDLLGKIKESGTNSVAFSHLASAAAELYGGKARKSQKFLKEARDYEIEYGTEVVWPNGKIKPHDPAHYDRLGEFAGEIEGVKGDDSEGSWLDAAEFIYTRTQEAFEISEFEESDEIRLYRGIPAGHLPEANDGGMVELDLNALSSWTFNRSTAAHVATQSGEGILLRVDVPVNRVFSMWATGPGSRESMEYLILGQDGIKAWATKINRK
jgi:2'-5' RNA ligase